MDDFFDTMNDEARLDDPGHVGPEDQGSDGRVIPTSSADQDGPALAPLEPGRREPHDEVDPWSGSLIDPWRPGHLILEFGDAGADARHWRAQGPDETGGFATQASIIASLTGTAVGDDDVATWSRERQRPDAAPARQTDGVTGLLDARRVRHVDARASILDIVDAISDGSKVMALLNARSDGIDPEPAVDDRPPDSDIAGHVVWVTGVGYDVAAATWKVVVNDPAHPHGRANQIPLTRFLRATDDFGNWTIIVPAGQHPVLESELG